MPDENQNGNEEREHADTGGEHQPENQNGGNGSDSGAGGAGGGTGEKSLQEIVAEEVAKALKQNGGMPSSRVGNIEANAERMVREAAERVLAQKVHDEEHERLRQAKSEPETPPVKVRKLTKLFWGNDE